MRGKIKHLTYKECRDFLLPKHYSGRMPSISWAWGWFIDNKLQAVCTFGKPASNTLCNGICGKEFSFMVFELNRLCRVDDLNEPLSAFVGACLRRLSFENVIIVAYSDTNMDHHGYIYQACNFLYTGCTKQRTVKYTLGNKHSRHTKNKDQGEFRKIRTAKHRYVFFAIKNRKFKKQVILKLNYKTKPYPKGDNKNYILGEFQKPIVYKVKCSL
ncbi:MAG: hypothetical protein GY853_13600 [PVC group bacterium]|nr:hypothetical protein [PVC group bacterium]